MKVWSALFNVIGLVLIVVWFSITITQKQQYDDFYTSSALKIKTEYATEAAMYTYVGNDIYWVDTYSAMMCNEYNMASSDLNRDRVLDSVEAAIFISDSSVEALRRNKYLNDYAVQIIPIIYDLSANEKLMVNAFDGKVKYLRESDNLLLEASNMEELQYLLNARGITIDITAVKANRQLEITKILNKALMKSYFGMNEQADRFAYLPTTQIGSLGINDIFGKSLIVIQKDFRHWNDRMITTAGYEKVDRVWTIGFVEGGVKYYCREDEVPGGINNVAGNRMFRTIYEAAAAGYIPATHYMK